MTDDVTTLRELKEVLEEHIPPENSTIIEVRIAALRYGYFMQEKFASKTEELADALRRTLIIEGMAATKANKISVL